MTSPIYSEISDTNNFVTESVSIAMQRIFEMPDVRHLDLADGLKQLLQERHLRPEFSTSVRRGNCSGRTRNREICCSDYYRSREKGNYIS